MKKLFVIVFLLISVSTLTAQDVFAPFVSRIQSANENGQVLLTWEDSRDVDGTYRIYRSGRIIGEASFDEAVLVTEIPSGRGLFIDKPDQTGFYYYAVLIVGTDGTEYKVFIPYRNVLVNPVQVSQLALPDSAYRAVTASALSATVDGSGVNIAFDRNEELGKLVLLQATSAITSLSDARSAVIVAILRDRDTAFRDAPVPATPYYYAVLDLEGFESGDVSVVPGQNATFGSVTVPLGDRIGLSYFKPSSDMPLPFLTLRNAVLTGDDLANPLAGQFPDKVDLSLDTEKYLSIIFSRMEDESSEALGAVILPVDRVLSENPEVRALQGVLQAYFDRGDWAGTIESLGKYLSFDRDESVEARTHFYLGQCFYFAGDYYSAVREFLFAETEYYAETQEWLSRSYIELRD